MRIEGNVPVRSGERRPRIGRGVIDLRDRGVAQVACRLARGHHHAAVPKLGDRRVIAAVLHLRSRAPGLRRRIEDGRVVKPVRVADRSAGDEHSSVRKESVAGAEEIRRVERRRSEAIGGRVKDLHTGPVGVRVPGENLAVGKQRGVDRHDRPRLDRRPLSCCGRVGCRGRSYGRKIGRRGTGPRGHGNRQVASWIA